MQKRKILMIALGVTDEWNPLPLFREWRETIPMIRLLGFATPMLTSRATAKEWSKEARATLGVYGWRGTTFEMHDWTIGETYLKLRDVFDRGPFSPILFPPDQALSNEAIAVVASGDTTKGLPAMSVCGEYKLVDSYDPKVTVLPFETNATNDGTLALFITPRTDIPKLLETLQAAQAEMHFISPTHNQRSAKGTHFPQLKEAKL